MSVVTVAPAEPLASDPRVDSPAVFSRSVRARGLTTIFDSDMFRTIFSDFSFSFSLSLSLSFNFVACNNSASTLDYDEHIVDS